MSKKKLAVQWLRVNGNIKYRSSRAGAMMLVGSHLWHKAHRDQRRECTGVDPPPTFGWPPNHLTPVQEGRHFPSLRGVERSSPSCHSRGQTGGFIFPNMNNRTDLGLFFPTYLFIPKSCLTASSNTFFNSETENQTADFEI